MQNTGSEALSFASELALRAIIVGRGRARPVPGETSGATCCRS